MLSMGGALALSGEASARQISGPANPKPKAPAPALPLEQFQPRSMLHAKETKVAKAAYPVIDIHTHITHAGGLTGPGKLRFAATAEECLAVMDRKNIRTLVNLTSGYGANLQEAIDTLQAAHPGRFIAFTEPAWTETPKPG